MTSKQVSVFLEIRPGALTELWKVLEEENINVRAMCLAEAEDFGVLRLMADDPYNVTTKLQDRSYVCKLTNVLTVEIDDKPGALVKTFEKLSDAGVNINYSYAFLSKKANKAYLVIRVSHTKEALSKLEGADVKIICQDEMSELFDD